MGKLNFTKMAGAGNDFIVISSEEKDFSSLARKLCERKTGIGADGMLVIGRSKTADFRMQIFNADGSEAEMCGNGLRCAVLYNGKKEKIKVETIAGIYEGEITGKNRVMVKMEDPKDLKMGIPIEINSRKLKVNFINTGVPHTAIFVNGIDRIDVDNIGRAVRSHEAFKPKGTNVDFVEIIDDENIRIRTFERGVEGETLACGTGAVASAIIASHDSRIMNHEINVHTKGGTLKVAFEKKGSNIQNVYLDGEAKEIFTGQTTLHL